MNMAKLPILKDKKRRCAMCYEYKSLRDFPKNAKMKGGVNAYCKICTTAYNKNRKERLSGGEDKIKCEQTINKIQHRAEIEFTKNFFDHKNWLYSPANFKLNGTTYTPDFYDSERDVWIEVVGSRQAYHANKRKYLMFSELYPKMVLEFRREDGTMYQNKSDNEQEGDGE